MDMLCIDRSCAPVSVISPVSPLFVYYAVYFSKNKSSNNNTRPPVMAGLSAACPRLVMDGSKDHTNKLDGIQYW